MRILSSLFLGLALTANVHANDYSFATIQSYTYEGDKGLGSYGISKGDITIPGTGGLVSEKQIPLKPGSKIELELKSGYEITPNGKWVQMFKIGLYKNSLKYNSDIKTQEAANEFISFNIFSNFITDSRYIGFNKSNYVKANISKSIHEDKEVYFDNSAWNKFTLSVKDQNTIILYVNDKESLVYKGALLDNAYLVIGTNLAVSFYMKQAISVNDSEGNIKVTF